MFYLKKTIEVSSSHNLHLDYESKCTSLHGHNWLITVYCKNDKLNQYGMIVDFTLIKNKINEALDHKHLNGVFTFNPTAENIAEWIVDTIPYCYKATVQETDGNEVTFEED